jgi:hypothetical protein
MCRLVSQATNFKDFCYAHTQSYTHTEGYQGSRRSLAWCTHKTVREYYYSGTTTLDHLNLVVHRDYSSPSHGLYVNLAVRRDYSSPAARALHQPHRALRLLVPGHTCSTSTSSCTASTRLHSPGCSDLLRLCRKSGCLGTSRGSSRDLLHCSLSTTSPTPRVRMPRHVAWLVVDYFTYAARPGASARHAARRAAHRRLLLPHHVSGCLDMSRGLLHGSSSTTPPTPRVRVARLVVRLVVDYFSHAARPGASARRAAHRVAHHRQLRHTSGCLGMSRGSSRGSSCCSTSTSSPTPCVRVPRHIARLVVDYFAYAARPGASARRAARRRLLRLHRASGCLDTPRGSSRGSCRLLRALQLGLAATLALLQPRCASQLLVSRQNWLYFEYATHRRNIVFWSHHIDHSSRLVFQTSQERQSRCQQLVGINSE